MWAGTCCGKRPLFGHMGPLGAQNGSVLGFWGYWPLTWALGPFTWALGPLTRALGPLTWALGPTYSGPGPTYLGPGPTYLGPGPTYLRPGPTYLGQGPSLFCQISRNMVLGQKWSVVAPFDFLTPPFQSSFRCAKLVRKGSGVDLGGPIWTISWKVGKCCQN